jgi:hypothetical protein
LVSKPSLERCEWKKWLKLILEYKCFWVRKRQTWNLHFLSIFTETDTTMVFNRSEKLRMQNFAANVHRTRCHDGGTRVAGACGGLCSTHHTRFQRTNYTIMPRKTPEHTNAWNDTESPPNFIYSRRKRKIVIKPCKQLKDGHFKLRYRFS